MGHAASVNRNSGRYQAPRGAAAAAAAYPPHAWERSEYAGWGGSPSAAREERKAAEKKLAGAYAAVREVLEEEAEVTEDLWAAFEEELRESFEQAAGGGGAAGTAQLRSALLAAVKLRDSTQLAVAMQRAAKFGLRLRSATLQTALEELLAQEESEGLWRCVASALVEKDLVAFAFWLEEAQLKKLDIPAELLEYWSCARSPSGSSHRFTNYYDDTVRVTDWDYQEVFDVRSMEAHAQCNKRELQRLVAEAKWYGADPGMAEAALVSLESDRGAAEGRPPSLYCGPAYADPELAALRGWSASALKAELARFGADCHGMCEKSELMQLLCALRAKAATPGAAASGRDHHRDGGSSQGRSPQRAQRSPQSAQWDPARSGGSTCGSSSSAPPSGGSPAQPAGPHGAEAFRRDPGRRSGSHRSDSHRSDSHRSDSHRSDSGHRPSAGGGAGGSGLGRGEPPSAGPRPSPSAGAGRRAAPPGGEEEQRKERPERPSPPPTQHSAPLTRAGALGCLGLAADSSPTEVELRQAYKQAALQWHPDRPHNHTRKEEATRQFQQARAAFELLRAGMSQS